MTRDQEKPSSPLLSWWLETVQQTQEKRRPTDPEEPTRRTPPPDPLPETEERGSRSPSVRASPSPRRERIGGSGLRDRPPRPTKTQALARFEAELDAALPPEQRDLLRSLLAPVREAVAGEGVAQAEELRVVLDQIEDLLEAFLLAGRPAGRDAGARG